jgi:hypothetical protein
MPIKINLDGAEVTPKDQELEFLHQFNAGSLANRPDLCLPIARLTMVAAR